MALRNVKVQTPDGKLVDGVDVPIVESTDRQTEIKLEDGSVLRIKPSVLGAIQIPGQFDPEGNPLYVLKSTLSMVVADAPATLKKGYVAAQAERKQ